MANEEQQQQIQQQISGGGFFQVFSHICVYNPFEIIIAVISLCVTLYVISTSSSPAASSSTEVPSFSDFTLGRNSQDDENLLISSKTHFNFWFITTLRFIAFVCILVQFKRHLKRLKSKMITSSSILMATLTSYLLNKALIEYYNLETTVNTLLVFDTAISTIVIIDLKKCNAIFSQAHEHLTKVSVEQSFADFASKSILDTCFFILLLALGNLSELKEIRQMALFGCVLLTSNYVVFMTIYPALLSLTLQFVNKKPPKDTTKKTAAALLPQQQQQQSHQPQQQQQQRSKFLTNPVLIYVKVLMTVFLIMVHLKSKFFSDKQPGAAATPSAKKNASSSYFSPTQATIVAEKEESAAEGELFSDSQYIFYTECVLLATLNIYILSKLLIIDSPAATATTPATTPTSSKACASTQTDDVVAVETNKVDLTIATTTTATAERPKRPLEECVRLLTEMQAKQSQPKLDEFLDEEVVEMVLKKNVPIYKLEAYFSNAVRGIQLRRHVIELNLPSKGVLQLLPFEHYNYSRVTGQCCENVLGYVPVPLGLAGPLRVDGQSFYLPMATTEGTLVASTNRGCTALNTSGGVSTKILSDGMTRAPVLRFPSGMRSAECAEWAAQPEHFARLKAAFDATSCFAKLKSIKSCLAGRCLYMRFVASTGDAMGMNMLSKGCEAALRELRDAFPDAELVSLSGNYCTDKKPSAINWIEGRGKSILCEAIVPGHVVRTVLKTTVSDLVDLNVDKNLVGSAMAGCMGGGFNAHAANVVAAMYIACGQDPAQVVEGCNCITVMEQEGEDLYLSCTMPSLEVGTVGGGTNLEAQASCLKMLGVQGSHAHRPGENASTLARIIASAVLAGELSLMSALAAGHLVNSHMRYNRASAPVLNPHGII